MVGFLLYVSLSLSRPFFFLVAGRSDARALSEKRARHHLFLSQDEGVRDVREEVDWSVGG